MARFIIVFAVLMSAFYGIAATPWFRDHFFPAYLRINARASAAILRTLGEDSHSNGADIVSPRFGLAILRGCDGVEPAALFIAAVLAFPASWRSRIVAAIGGTATLLALNLVRIVSLYYTGIYFPKAFDTVHLDLWQTLFILIVMTMWMTWAWRVSRRLRTHAVEER